MSRDAERLPIDLDLPAHASSIGQPGAAEGPSGSKPFDRFRSAAVAQPGLLREMEAALQLLIDRVDPRDRGARFVVGTAVEWIVAAAAWATGVLSAPGGHSVDGFDLQDLEDRARGMWSVKSSFRPDASTFRITNGLGGAGRGMTDPTVFLHPRLPGMVLVHPEVHGEVVAKIRQKSDGTDLPFGPLRDHAARSPACVIPMDMPANEHRGHEDAALLFTKGLLGADRFPRLSSVFSAAEPRRGSVVEELTTLSNLHAAGMLDDDEFTAAKARLLGAG